MRTSVSIHNRIRQNSNKNHSTILSSFFALKISYPSNILFRRYRIIIDNTQLARQREKKKEEEKKRASTYYSSGNLPKASIIRFYGRGRRGNHRWNWFSRVTYFSAGARADCQRRDARSSGSFMPLPSSMRSPPALGCYPRKRPTGTPQNGATNTPVEVKRKERKMRGGKREKEKSWGSAARLGRRRRKKRVT